MDCMQLAELFSRREGFRYQLLPGKRRMYQAKDSQGQLHGLCFSSSRYHDTICGHWFDLTEKQKKLMDSMAAGHHVALLDGVGVSVTEWHVLSALLTAGTMCYNTREGNHWKLYVRNGRLEVQNGGSIGLQMLKLEGNGVAEP